jgi:hypothetical protein
METPRRLWGIRHATSEFNVYAHNIEWGSPHFQDRLDWRDTRLARTATGDMIDVVQKQLEKVRVQLIESTERARHVELDESEEVRSLGYEKNKQETATSGTPLDLSKIDLIVASPLTRCLETLMYGVVPAYESLGLDLPPIIALDLLTERIYTCSDHGSPVSQLEPVYPQVDFSHIVTPDHWWWDLPATHEWYANNKDTDTGIDAGEQVNQVNGSDNTDASEQADVYNSSNRDENKSHNVPGELQELSTMEYTEWRPHGDGQWYAVPGEPANAFARRMGRLRDWLASRRERNILIVSHWGVLTDLAGVSDVDNCSIVELKWPSITQGESEGKKEEQDVRVEMGIETEAVAVVDEVGTK